MDRRDLSTTREEPPRRGADESRCAGEAAAVAVPPYVLEDAARERWELCRGIAERITGAPAESEDGWMLVRWLFRSDMPTHQAASASRD